MNSKIENSKEDRESLLLISVIFIAILSGVIVLFSALLKNIDIAGGNKVGEFGHCGEATRNFWIKLESQTVLPDSILVTKTSGQFPEAQDNRYLFSFEKRAGLEQKKGLKEYLHRFPQEYNESRVILWFNDEVLFESELISAKAVERCLSESQLLIIKFTSCGDGGTIADLRKCQVQLEHKPGHINYNKGLFRNIINAFREYWIFHS